MEIHHCDAVNFPHYELVPANSSLLLVMDGSMDEDSWPTYQEQRDNSTYPENEVREIWRQSPIRQQQFLPVTLAPSRISSKNGAQ